MPYTGRYVPSSAGDINGTDITAWEAETNVSDAKVVGATETQAGGSSNQSSTISNNVVHLEVVTDADADSTVNVSAAATTLNEGGELSASDTTVTVTSGAVFPSVPFTVICESEQMRVTNVATNDLTVIRGWDGTTAATHADSTAITQYIDEDSTVFDVSDGSGFAAGDRIKIGSTGTEEIKITNVATNRLTVSRGESGTPKAVIANAADVYKIYGPEETLDVALASVGGFVELGDPTSSLA